MKLPFHVALYCLVALTSTIQAQTDSLPKHQLTVSGYAEIFYAWDFNADKYTNPAPPLFLYNYNRHNEVNLNLALVKAAYTAPKLRANLALMAGSYPNANLASEPDGFRHVFETNAGVRLGKRMWLDVGILPSHLGFESAIGKDNPTLTRSLAAENSPYYEAGARLSWSDDTWAFAALYLNGWQRITRYTNAPSIGTQITWKPSERVTINYSNFLQFNANSLQYEQRFFHNLYGIFTLSPDWQLSLGYDYGTGQQFAFPTRSENINWSATTAILRWQCTRRWALAARAEYYHDPKGAVVQIPDSPGNRFYPIGMDGYSLNVDYQILPNALARIEGRWLHNGEPVFSPQKKSRAWLTASLAVSF